MELVKDFKETITNIFTKLSEAGLNSDIIHT